MGERSQEATAACPRGRGTHRAQLDHGRSQAQAGACSMNKGSEEATLLLLPHRGTNEIHTCRETLSRGSLETDDHKLVVAFPPSVL